MVPYQIALVSEAEQVQMADLQRVTAALQKQITRDFCPLWNVQATIDCFSRLEDVPLGYWPIIIRTNLPDHAMGFHTDEQGQPYALIQYSDSWSLTASHECLEMLADPFGQRLVAGPSPKKDQGRVQYLMEICDPCESSDFAYTVNDILVSDFYTPHFFDPVRATGVRYSFTGAIQEPYQVLAGGYISWRTPTDGHWWQLRRLGIDEGYIDLGALQPGQRSLREMINSATPRTTTAKGLAAESMKLQNAREAAWVTGERTAAYAGNLHRHIDTIIHGAYASVS